MSGTPEAGGRVNQKRHFPDLASLLEEALAGIEPDPAAALAAGSDSGDPVERVAYAAELLARLVIERQGAIRALISVSIARATARQVWPGYRFALIDQALAPLTGQKPGIDAATLEQLRRDLAIVISAEAVLTLTDLYGLEPEGAVASIVHTARLIAEATLSRPSTPTVIAGNDVAEQRRSSPTGSHETRSYVYTGVMSM
jgi:hypothetical protein